MRLSFLEKIILKWAIGAELGRTENAVAWRLGSLKLKRRPTKNKNKISRPTDEKLLAPVDEIISTELLRGDEGRHVVSPSNKDFLIIDFSTRPELFDKLQTIADENFRPPEYQIFYLIDKAVNDAGHD